jgi:hypothetical protein
MTTVTEEFNQLFRELFTDPSFKDLFAMKSPKTHRAIQFSLKANEYMYHYFKGKNGALHCYSPHPDTTGRYWCWTLLPQGKGARSGKANEWRTTHLVECARRKTARAKAQARATKSYQVKTRAVADDQV